MHVLLVEDDAVLADGIARNLSNHGIVVDVVSNGLDADVILKRRTMAAIVLDIGLPGIDGFEVARRAREAIGDDIVLIALSGYGQVEDARKAREAGFDLHMVKPVDASRLRKLLATERSQLRAAVQAQAAPSS